MNEDNIRIASVEDAQEILEIYEPYILNTAITFEYDAITIADFQERMRKVQEQFPWLVYVREGKILGYAYCSRFKERAAFDWDCECSVYIRESAHHQGIASALYTKLFELIQKQGYYNIYALITASHESSIALHRKFGFTKVGIYTNNGYKLGKWWDLLVMEKRISSFEKIPEKIKSILEI